MRLNMVFIQAERQCLKIQLHAQSVHLVICDTSFAPSPAGLIIEDSRKVAKSMIKEINSIWRKISCATRSHYVL